MIESTDLSTGNNDHVVNISGSLAASNADLGPPSLLEDPDGKDKFNAGGWPAFAKVFRFVFIIQPWIPLLVVTLWSAVAVGIATRGATLYPPERRYACRYLCTPISYDGIISGYVGFAISVLLGFRVNEAYGRYERGLQIWNETISCTVSSFATHAGRIFPEGTWHSGDRKRVFAWLAAFPITLKRKLRGERDVPELRSVLSEEDIQILLSQPNMPSYCLAILNTYIMKATTHQDKLPQVFINRMLNYCGQLALSMYKCENITQHSVNYGYLAHLRLIMGIWIFLLPFSMVQDCGWYTIIIVPAIGYGLIAMEKIAEELAQPFGYDFNDVPIGLITNQIVQGIQDKYILAVYCPLKATVLLPL